MQHITFTRILAITLMVVITAELASFYVGIPEKSIISAAIEKLSSYEGSRK